MIGLIGVKVEPADLLEWRCTSCVVRPLFGMYTELGGLHIRTAGRVHQSAHYVSDLLEGSMKAHCRACHSWQELRWNDESGCVEARVYEGPRPAIACECTREGA